MSKEEPKGEYEFKLPDFDEDTFIHREMTAFKTTTTLFVWGIAAAGVSLAAYYLLGGDPRLGWLAGMGIATAFGLSLRWLFVRIRADIAHFKRREWLGTATLFFFTWLSAFLVAVNPPFSDFAPPDVQLSASPPLQLPSGTVTIALLASDNDRLEAQSITVQPPNQPAMAPAETGRAGSLRYYNLTLDADGPYTVTATATDGKGRTTTEWSNFTVGAAGFEVELPKDAVLGRTEAIVATLSGHVACTPETYGQMPPCVRVLRFRLAGGGEVLLDPVPDRNGEWKADVNSKGWVRGPNTFTAEAEFLDGFVGPHRVPGGKLALATPFTVNVTHEPGQHVYEPLPPRPDRAMATPSLQVPAALAVLVLGAALVRLRRDRTA